MSERVLSETERAALKEAVQQMVESQYRAQAEKDLQRDIKKKIVKELEIPNKIFGSLSKRAYKQDAANLNHETTEILDLAEELGFYSYTDDQ